MNETCKHCGNPIDFYANRWRHTHGLWFHMISCERKYQRFDGTRVATPVRAALEGDADANPTREP